MSLMVNLPMSLTYSLKDVKLSKTNLHLLIQNIILWEPNKYLPSLINILCYGAVIPFVKNYYILSEVNY